MNKNNKTIEIQLDHLDRFTHVKTYHEFNIEIPHLEGGIPILDQSLKFPFEKPTLPCEETQEDEVLTTSPKHEAQLDDMIESIGRLNL